jgi:hypothetical protein
MCKSFKDDSYTTYYKTWANEYRGHEDSIRRACAELIAIKKFTRACDVPDGTISEWVTSQWFMQRVFDHYLVINASHQV